MGSLYIFSLRTQQVIWRNSFSELMKSASNLYKYATDAEKRKLAHLVFLELTFKDGKLATYKAKPEFEILLNRPSVQDGSRHWTHLGRSIGANLQENCRQSGAFSVWSLPTERPPNLDWHYLGLSFCIFYCYEICSIPWVDCVPFLMRYSFCSGWIRRACCLGTSRRRWYGDI